MTVEKKVKLKLVGVDGNAFSVMGAFSTAARRQGWTKEEIKVVIDEAMAGDYNHLLATIVSHIEPDTLMGEEECSDCGYEECECDYE